MESSGNEEVDTLLFFRCLYVSFGGNVFAYLSSGSYVDVFSVSFKYEVFPKQTSILQTPILFLFPPFSAEGFPIFIHPQAKGLTTIISFSCPGSHHIPSVLPEVSPTRCQGCRQRSRAAECNWEQFFWRQIWKYMSIVLKICTLLDPAISLCEPVRRAVKDENKGLLPAGTVT